MIRNTMNIIPLTFKFDVRRKKFFLNQIRRLLRYNIVPERHIPYIMQAKADIESNTGEMRRDPYVIFAAYRSQLIGAHLKQLSPDHPDYRKQVKMKNKRNATMKRNRRLKKRREYYKLNRKHILASNKKWRDKSKKQK